MPRRYPRLPAKQGHEMRLVGETADLRDLHQR